MIITPLIRKQSKAILHPTHSATLASGIVKHCMGDFDTVAKSIKAGAELKTVDSFKNSVAVLGLFIAYQSDFIAALNEVAQANDEFAATYLIDLTDIEESSIVESLAMLNDYAEFDVATKDAQNDCYQVIHAIVITIATHIIADYNLQKGLLAARTAAYEESQKA